MTRELQDQLFFCFLFAFSCRSQVRGGKASFPEDKKKETPLSAGSFSAVLQAHSWKRCSIKDETSLSWRAQVGWIVNWYLLDMEMGNTYSCVVFKEPTLMKASLGCLWPEFLPLLKEKLMAKNSSSVVPPLMHRLLRIIGICF